MSKTSLIWIVPTVFILCSVFVASTGIPDRGYVYFDCNGDVTDQWGHVDATWGVKQQFQANVPTFNKSGDGGNQSCDFDTTNYLISNVKPNENNFTIDLWFKPDANGATNGLAGTITNGGTDRLGFSLLTVSADIQATIYDAGGPNNFDFGGVDAKANVWTKYTYVYENTSSVGNSGFYINGSLVGNISAAISQFFDVIHIGSQFASLPLTNSMNGAIDEIRIFNRSLSKAEVEELYNRGELNFTPPSVINFTISSNIDNFTAIIAGEYCYQETANISTNCGGLSSGSYSFPNSFGVNWTPTRDNLFDGNFVTSAVLNSPGNNDNATMLINYRKPFMTTNASLWKVKDFIDDVNLTIPNSCWNYDEDLMLRVSSSNVNNITGSRSTRWFCYDGSWNLLRQVTAGGGGVGHVFEEAMFWDAVYYNTTTGEITTSLLSNATILFNITVLTNNLTINNNFLNYNVSSQMYSPFAVLNFTVFKLDASTQITAFNVTLNSSVDNQKIVVTNIFNQIVVANNTNYNYTIDATGFFNATGNISTNTFVQTYVNITILLNSKVDVTFIFLDEITLAPQFNISFDVFSNTFSGSFNSTTSSNFSFISLPEDDYEIRYGLFDDVRAARSFYLRIPHTNLSAINITLLTINQSVSTQIIRTIVDQNSLPLVGSLLEIQRPYTSNDNTSLIYRTVEIALVDSTGEAIFTAIPNTQAYRMRVLTDFSLVKTFTPEFLVSTQKELTVDDALPVGANFNSMLGISSRLIFNKTSSFYVFDYFDSEQVSSEVCLTVTNTFRANTTATQICNSAKSGTILIFVNQSQNGTFTTLAQAVIEGGQYTLANDVLNFQNQNFGIVLASVAGILFFLSIIFAGTLSGYINPVFPITAAIMFTIAFSLSFLGMYLLSAALIGGVMVVGVIILILVKK